MGKPVRLTEVFLCSLVKGEVSYQGGALKWKFRIAWKRFLADQPEQAALPVSRAEEKNSQSRETLKSPPSEKSIQKKEPSEQLKKQPEPIQKKITKPKTKRNRIQDRDLESGFLKKRNR